MGALLSKLQSIPLLGPLLKALIAILRPLVKTVTSLPFLVVHFASRLLPLLFPTSASRLYGVKLLNLSIRAILPICTAHTVYMAYKLLQGQSLINHHHPPSAATYFNLFATVWSPLEIVFFAYECYVGKKLQELSKPPPSTAESREVIQNKLIAAVHYLHDYIPVEELKNHRKLSLEPTAQVLPSRQYSEHSTSATPPADSYAASKQRIVRLPDGKELVEIEWDVRRYLQGWFLDCPLEEIYLENIADFIVTGGLSKKLHECSPEEREEVMILTNRMVVGPNSNLRTDKYVRDGFNSNIEFICPPYDHIYWHHRPAFIYGGIAAIHGGTSLVLRSMGYTKHVITMNNGKELHFYHRRPKRSAADDDDDIESSGDSLDEAPIVFCHGIGLGLTPYLGMIKQLHKANEYNVNTNKRNTREREVFLLEFKHVSMLRVHKIPSELETAHAVALMLSLSQGGRHQSKLQLHTIETPDQAAPVCRPAVFIGHSYGTLSLAWFVKYHPSMIGRLIFTDPICFLLFTHELSYKFFHKPPRTPFETIAEYWVSQELYIGNTLTRHMRWTESACFKEDLMTLRRHTCRPAAAKRATEHDMNDAPALKRDDSSNFSGNVKNWQDRAHGQPLLGHSHSSTDDLSMQLASAEDRSVQTYVFLSQKDSIVGTKSVYNYLKANFNDTPRKQSGNQIHVEMFEDYEHAQFLFNQNAQQRIIEAITK